MPVDQGTECQPILPASPPATETEEHGDIHRSIITWNQSMTPTFIWRRFHFSLRSPQNIKKISKKGYLILKSNSPDMEVLDIDIPVGGSLSLAPQKKPLLGRGF